MDFKTAAAIAKEQDMFLTTDEWLQSATQAAQKVPGMVVHMTAYRFVDGVWKMGDVELATTITTKKHYDWRVCAKDIVVQ